MYARYSKIRDEKGLNDLTVANGAGVPQSTIYDWKQRSADNANASLSVDNLSKIAKFLGVSLEKLLED